MRPAGKRASKGGKREDLDNRFFRSRWEANYARYLNWMVKRGEIERWEYETVTFEFPQVKRGTRFYTPDFKIFNKDGSHEFHEVKGYMDAKSITRHTRMARYFPHEKLVMIDKAFYLSLAKEMSRLIPGWEVG